jgi:hypothetical protein
MSKKKTTSKQRSIYQSLGRAEEDETIIKQLKAARTDFGVLTQTPYIVGQQHLNNSGDASIATQNNDHTKISGEESDSNTEEAPFAPHKLCFPL